MQRLAIICVILMVNACRPIRIKSDEYEALRKIMVNDQIAGRGIRDEKVLSAMRKIPRHMFVPEKLRKSAYEDYPLPIGEEQTISQPYIVALMTEALRLTGSEKVLEIGTGSGYQAAVLSLLAKEVYTIEILPTLAQRAESTLKALGFTNILVRCADGYLGWSEHAPFDAIIITCAPEKVPDSLIRQLAEKGRLVVPLGSENKAQMLTLFTKSEGRLDTIDIAPVIFVPMKGVIEKEK